MKQYCKHGHDTFATGRTSTRHCKVCCAERAAARYVARRPEYLEKERSRRANDPEKIRQANRRQKGIKNLPTVGASMGALCQCCNMPIKTVPCADHDHNNMQFRGWVCYRCNSWLAALEKPGWLELAQAYLKARRLSC